MITLPLRGLIERYHMSDKATIGRLSFPETGDGVVCHTLELSKWGLPCCIPCGVYPVRGAPSPRLERIGKTGEAAMVWWVDNVPGRQAIQIHTANEPKELRGCIAPGLTVSGTMAYISDSRLAFNRLTKLVGGFGVGWELEIRETA